MKITPALVIDVIFTAFISFILYFILLNYFFAHTLALGVSATLCALSALFAFKILYDKNVKIRLSRTQKKQLERTISQLNLYTTTEQNDLFERAVKKLGYTTQRKKGLIYILEENCALYLRFGFDGVSKTDIVKAFNAVKSDQLVYVFAEKFSPEVEGFAKRFDGRIITVQAEEAYKFLSENDCLPKEKFSFTQKKNTALEMLKSLFYKKHARRFAIFGSIFLFTSYFTPIKLYYVIFGSLFLSFALLCRLFGKERSVKG